MPYSKPYRPRRRGSIRKRNLPHIDPATGGTVAPPAGPQPVRPPKFKPGMRRNGFTQQLPEKRIPRGSRVRRRPIPLKPGKGSNRRYFGRGA